MSDSPAITVCQVGYLPEETKIGLVTASDAGEAQVYRLPDDVPVLTAALSPPVADPDSGDTVRVADFSALTIPGTYQLNVSGVGRSDPFEIGADLFVRPFHLAMRMFTGQRCGMDVSLAPDFPEYHYPACHTAQAEYDPSSGTAGTRPCPGGWHDAGDYGRYVVNSGITTGTLLWAYEFNAEKLKSIVLDLPESGGSVPDVLAEIRWNMDWMLTMQDDDGGAWHKATTARFPGFVMPQEDTASTLIIGQGDAPYKTTAATADLAAVCAIAARIYRECDAQFADSCLHAAQRAWDWLAVTPDHNYVHNPPGIETGGYGDPDPRDERLWAAAELFRTTGEAKYNHAFLAQYTAWVPTVSADSVQAWPDVRNLAMYAYALSELGDAAAKQQIRADAIAAADALVARSLHNGYRVPMRDSDYIWGSNSVVANYGMMTLIAHRFQPKAAYIQCALDALHYLFGRNTFGTSFVTHIGSRWPMSPHHRPSGADGVEQPWPGMLVGGPNAGRHTPPARQWVDEEASFTTNEVAINWNAPLVFLLAEVFPAPVNAEM